MSIFVLKKIHGLNKYLIGIGNMKKVLVLGAGGFIGSHMVKQLKSEGHYVRGVDIKFPEFGITTADEFILHDLRDVKRYNEIFNLKFDDIYQFAADMGGAGYIFTKEHDADIMHNSATINLNVLNHLVKTGHLTTKVFYSSSACMYPEHNQLDPNNPNCEESSAYPANPDSEYGWEKLFSERLYLAYHRNYNIQVRIARYHNIYGPMGTWRGGKEKAPAAICRKVAETHNNGTIEIWGDGLQTRSFLYIDECINATRKLMDSDFMGPVNIGSDEMVTINELVGYALQASGKQLSIKHIEGPTGVRGRNSDNKLYFEKIGYYPKYPLVDGIKQTYDWIAEQLAQ